jgi:hypothetical protein
MAKKAGTTKPASTYDVHPVIAEMATWVGTLPARTGRSIDQWADLVIAKAPADQPGRKKWLREQHPFKADEANWIVQRASGVAFAASEAEYLAEAESIVSAMFAGPKASLLPIHDAIMAMVRKLSKELRVCPCKTMIPMYHNHVIAQMKPTTRTRLDLGFALKGQKTPAYLVDTGGAAKGDRITHRLELTSPDQVDERALRWLTKALELDS